MEDDNSSSRLQNPVFNLAMGVMPDTSSNFFDDDGRINRSGTVWTASAHIITAVIGSGVLSLAWAMAQLGWVAGPTVMLLFSFMTYYTSSLLADCYRSGDPVTGRRNHTYMGAAGTILGRMRAIICGMNQYVILWAVAIGYSITASISMMEIKRSNCIHETRGESPCLMAATPYMITFAAMQIVLSQIPDFDQVSWISTVAAVMSFTYSIIALGLAIDKVAENGKFGGRLTGIISGDSIQTNKIWRSSQALGDMAFAYTFSMIFLKFRIQLDLPSQRQ